MENVLVLPIPSWRYVVGGAKCFCSLAEKTPDLLLRPDVELAFFSLAVGILSAVVAAALPLHFPERPLERLASDTCVSGVGAELISLQVASGKEGVVVEHLLEVRYEPAIVCRITMKATAQMIVHPA